MMLLPLGFGGRFPSFPWATTLLCFTIFAVHLLYGSITIRRLEALHENVYHKIVLSPSYANAVTTYCTTRELPIAMSITSSQLLHRIASVSCSDDLKHKTTLSGHIKKNDAFHKAFVYTTILPYPDHFGMNDDIEELLGGIALFNKSHGIFSADNSGLFPMIVSQFLHANWFHLFSNLIVLFLVGCLVECRRSAWVMLSVFVLGGCLGFALEISQNSTFGYRSLVGASAGISAVAGLFTAFFFRFRMRFLLFVIPPFYKTFHASNLVILPLIFFASDIINSLALGTQTGVAHLAHLGGAVFGLAIGLSFEKLRPIRWPLLYGFEEQTLKQIQSHPNPHRRIHSALDLLRVNPENMLAAEAVCKETIGLIDQGFPVTPEFRDILKQFIPTLMSVHSRRKDPHLAFALVPTIPPQISLMDILDRSSQPVLVAGMKWAQSHAKYWSLLRFYEVWIVRFGGQRRLNAALADVSKILNEIKPTADNHRYLSVLYQTSPQGVLATSYYQRLQSMFESLHPSACDRKQAA
jgi:membrane associated rhomboid family serine protease